MDALPACIALSSARQFLWEKKCKKKYKKGGTCRLSGYYAFYNDRNSLIEPFKNRKNAGVYYIILPNYILGSS